MENLEMKRRDGSVWTLTSEMFGDIWPYIIDNDVTDIDWDAAGLSIERADGTVEIIDNPNVNEKLIYNLVEHISNFSNEPFNEMHPTIETETDTLRITCVHEEFATSGRSISIRKTLPEVRFSVREAVENRYENIELLNLLANCIKARLSMCICGMPGAGKTERAKFASTFISAEEKVITIEDVREWHYSKINPGKRCIEIKVRADEENKEEMYEEYIKAIKTALRLNPTWLMLSETRSKEAMYLLEALSTGISGITTLHTNDVRNLQERICSMVGSINENKKIVDHIFTFMNVGMLVEQVDSGNGKKKREITQFCFYHKENGKNKCTMIYENGQLNKEAIPESVKAVFEKRGIKNPFFSEDFDKRAKQVEEESKE